MSTPPAHYVTPCSYKIMKSIRSAHCVTYNLPKR